MSWYNWLNLNTNEIRTISSVIFYYPFHFYFSPRCIKNTLQAISTSSRLNPFSMAYSINLTYTSIKLVSSFSSIISPLCITLGWLNAKKRLSIGNLYNLEKNKASLIVSSPGFFSIFDTLCLDYLILKLSEIIANSLNNALHRQISHF